MMGTGALTTEEPAVVVRAAELAELGGWATLAESGAAVLGIVAGEPGSGRSTLLRELGTRCAGRGFAVLPGAGRLEYARSPLAPVLQALGPLLTDTPERRRDVLRLLAAGAVGGAALEALAAVVDDASSARPVLLTVDDLHLADSATFTVLAYLVDRCRTRPLLVVGAARGRRPEELDRLRRRCRRTGTELVLGRLAAPEAEMLARSRGRAAPNLAVVHGRGLPAAITALADAVTPGDAEVHQSPALPDTVPAAFADAVAAHLDGLTVGERAVLTVIAAAGPAGVDCAALQAVLARTAAHRAERHAEGLVTAGLVSVHDGDWRLWHPLAAGAVTALVPDTDLAGTRRRLAAECAARLTADPSDLRALRVLAHQYRGQPPGADAPDRAEVLTAAAREAAARDDLADVLVLAPAALSATDGVAGPDPATRAELLELLGRAQARCGQEPAAVLTLTAARDHAAAGGDDVRQSRVQGLLDLQRWDDERAAEPGTESGRRTADREAWAIMWLARRGDRRDLVRAVERLSRITPDGESGDAAALRAIATGLLTWNDGDVVAALALIESVTHRATSPMLRYTAAQQVMRLRALTGDVAGAVAQAARLCARQDWSDMPFARQHALAWLASVEYCAGRLRDAQAHVHEAAVLLPDLRSERAAARVQLLGALLAAERGDRAAARAGVEAAVRKHPSGMDPSMQALAATARAVLAADAGEPPDAVDIAAFPIASYPHIISTLPVATARAALAVGALDVALAQVDELAGMSQSPVLRAQARRVEGLLAAAQGQRHAAAVLHEAAAELDDHGLGLHAAQCRTEWAEILVRSDRPDIAQLGHRLGGLLEYFRAEGVRPWEARVRRVARELGMTVRDRRPPDSPLTAREVDVARLVAEGLSNADIAQRLFVSVRTVETHMRNIYANLGLRTRQQVVDWARSHVPEAVSYVSGTGEPVGLGMSRHGTPAND